MLIILLFSILAIMAYGQTAWDGRQDVDIRDNRTRFDNYRTAVEDQSKKVESRLTRIEVVGWVSGILISFLAVNFLLPWLKKKTGLGIVIFLLAGSLTYAAQTYGPACNQGGCEMETCTYEGRCPVGCICNEYSFMCERAVY